MSICTSQSEVDHLASLKGDRKSNANSYNPEKVSFVAMHEVDGVFFPQEVTNSQVAVA